MTTPQSRRYGRPARWAKHGRLAAEQSAPDPGQADADRDYGDDDRKDDGPGADTDVAGGLAHLFVVGDLAVTFLVPVGIAHRSRSASVSRTSCPLQLSIE